MAATQQVVFSDKEKSNSEFFIYIHPEIYTQWKTDKSIPITRVVQAFNIYITRNGSSTGVAETPSNQELENVFGTSNDTAVVEHILNHGTVKGNSGIQNLGEDFNRSRGKGGIPEVTNNMY
ncbi:hypothetical protein K7432_006757 [Basidiobolus ranarum]|uniref:Ribosome maturation protein SDO1/SBDS N-terminal domain-containing protein n=1 Tax=Basidiobolus ranarum TaxID=34480 RepID=A0ABR2WUE3_9FUNG